MLNLILIIVCLTNGISTNTIPQCAENQGNKEEFICKDVHNMQDLRGFEQNTLKNLKIVNENVKQFEWNYIPQGFMNLEILDASHVGSLCLGKRAFESLTSLKALNISHCDLESIIDSYFGADNILENLDASHNALNILPKVNKLQSLEVANFSNNEIQSITTEVVLSKLRILHLDNNALEKVQLQNYESLEILSMSENDITKLSANSFKLLPSMQQLTITLNPLKYIEDRTFQSMIQLKTLNLSDNSLEILSPEAFVGLGNLIQLDVSVNNIKELANSQFQRLIKLQHLDISHNSLRALRMNNFYNLVHLRKLSINENDIELIEANTFANLTDLDTLDLSNNNIEYLDSRAFGTQTLARLRKLLLKSNNLKTLHPLTFASLPFMEYLSLGFNQLNALDVRMFAPMRRLQKLHLGNNLIESIPPEVIESITDVTELLLYKNRLSFLPESKVKFEHLKKISLEGNPWQCPCWNEMTTWLEARRVSYVRKESPYFSGKKPLCVVTPVNFCVRDLPWVREHKIEEIYNSS